MNPPAPRAGTAPFPQNDRTITTLASQSPASPARARRPSPARPWHRRRWAWGIGLATVLLVLSVVGLFMVPAQWAGWVVPGDSVVDSDAVAFRPGKATSTKGRIEADGIELFEPEGSILLTTVSIDSDLTVIEWIESSLRDSIELRTRWSVFGVRTTAEQREHNLQLMDGSKEAAVLVALEHLGVNAVDATGVGFGATVADGPSDGILRRGEVIVAIDAEPVTTLASLLELLAIRPPGTLAVVTVEDAETRQRRDAKIVLGSHPDADNDGGFIGVSRVQERIERHDLPFDLSIASGSVGGPSAGLAFTLTTLDLLTPGELTGGRRVAVTGTIGLDGSVGNVGGVVQKAFAAREAGAEVFIVPADLVGDARVGAGDMPVVGVGSLDEALSALAGYGGEVDDLALPSPPPPPGSAGV